MKIGDKVLPIVVTENQRAGDASLNSTVTAKVTPALVAMYRQAFEAYVQAGLEHARKHRTRVPADLSAQGCQHALGVVLTDVIRSGFKGVELEREAPAKMSRMKPAPSNHPTRVLRSLADLKGLDNAD